MDCLLELACAVLGVGGLLIVAECHQLQHNSLDVSEFSVQDSRTAMIRVRRFQGSVQICRSTCPSTAAILEDSRFEPLFA